MIISIDGEKAFDKIQHPFIIKTLQKMGIEGTYLNIVKAVYDKPTANIILNGQNLKVFPLRSGTIHRCPLAPLIQHSSGSPSYSNQRRKRNKRNPDQKIRSKALPVFKCMILYIENPKDSIRKSLELISGFSKVAGYKINTQKSLAFLYTTMKNQKKKLRNQSHSPLQQK